MQNDTSNSTTEQVRQKLEDAYQSLVSKRTNAVVLKAFLIFFTGFIAFIIAEQVLYLPIITKGILIASIFGVSFFAYRNGIKSAEKENFKEFYRSFSRKSDLPELKDTIDLQKSGGGNKALVDAAIFQNLSNIDPAKLSSVLKEYVESSVPYTEHKKFLALTGASFAVLLLTALNFGNGTERAFTFWQQFEKPNPYTYIVSPGNITLEQGSSFEVTAEFRQDNIPDEIILKIKTSVEEDFRTRVMEQSGTIFKSVPLELNNDLTYYVEMDGYKSDTYIADVQLRPRFTQLTAAVIPPAYTELDSTVSSYPFSNIRAYENSEIILSGKLNKDIAGLKLFATNEETDLSVQNDSSFTYKYTVSEADTFRFYMEDKEGLTNKNPFQIIIDPQTDDFPFVEILEPEENLRQVNPTELELLYRARDDFGLTSSSLNYELKRAYVEDPITGSVSLDTPTREVIEPYIWNLTEFNFKPRDQFTFWVTVQDNDQIAGYKTSSSQRITLEIPSMVEYFEDVDEKEEEVETDLDEISESFQQTQEQYERFKEMMKDNPENAGYEERRELEQAEEQQEEVQKKVEELNQKFEELKNELSSDNVLSEETQKAYQELQKLMDEIDDPAYKEAMEKLREQLGQMNPEQMRQAMEELEFNEELYKERLERTIELFKKLKLSSDLDKLAKSFENRAQKEEELAQQENPSKEEREQAIEENEKLKEQVDSLSENTSKNTEESVSEYQEQTQNELDELSEKMQKQLDSESQDSTSENSGEENSQNSDGDNNSDQQEGQESESSENEESQSQGFQQQYQQLAESTKSLMSGISSEQMNINIAGLQYVLYSLLNLSVEQEDLTTLASATDDRSQAYVTYARTQRNVDEIFSAVADSLFQLSADIPQFSNEINKKKLEVENRLDRSLEQMSERNQNQSSVASRQALGGINDIAFMVANLLEQLQNSDGQGGGGGAPQSMQQMMEQLGETGKQQQQLNQMMQDMINDIQGERLSQDQMERLEQIARQQNQIRKQLQELQQSGQLDGDRVGSEIERMIEDMEDTINDLRGGAANSTLIERQQNILSRMLEAEQAMQQRDEEDKREGTAAENYERSTPPAMTLEELEKEIRNRLNDPNFTKFSPDYQRLIENYFELLKQLQEREIQ
ncbi:hypothetical protein [Gracilimonas sp.]|uniref:hypothetical protein n=1 Tax=Gracilimonas sp. TaxID=1974203 RepID=UPI0028712671|nr:DUF4175 family protein [Gracilimonas sp.]